MSVSAQWKVSPTLDAPKKGIWLGSGGAEGDGVWLGTLAESATGRAARVYISTEKEHVTAVVGKRGSGKSFTLGAIVEGLCAPTGELGRQERSRAVLLFDPLDVYWTTAYPVGGSDNAEAQRHFDLARAVGIEEVELDVAAWIPGLGASRSTDPDWFQVLQIPVAALGVSEWELILGVDAVSDPMGQAMVEALTVVQAGYHLGEDVRPGIAIYDLPDLVEVLGSEELKDTYHRETLRALRQRMQSLAQTGLFSRDGTAIGELLAGGRASVVMLGRLPGGYRVAVVALLTRMLMEARSATAFAEKRLALDPTLDDSEREEVAAVATAGVPRTVVILDEAQAFLAPGEQSSARDLFVRLVKEGRNMGLSAVLATQQPSALDKRVLSQVENFISHQLVTEADIRAVRENLKSEVPTAIRYGSADLEFSGLLRQLPPGYCVVSAADVNTTVRRAFVTNVRPRATVHGGIEL